MIKIMQTKFLIFFFTFSALFFSSFQALGSWDYAKFLSCDSLNPNPIIRLKVAYGKLFHDSSTAYNQIQTMKSKSPETCPITSGFADLRLLYEINFKQEKTVEKGSLFCVFPKIIEVSLYYEEPTIYVANEYNYKSCYFSQVLRHFQTHQQINKVTFELALPHIYKAIRESFGQLKAYKALNSQEAGQASRKLTEYYTAQLETIIKKFEEIRLNENKKFDDLIKKDFLENTCKLYHKYHKDVPILKEATTKPIPF